MKGAAKPKISVVIPVLNGEHYLHECIESLLEQSANYECLIIDNGSTDRTEEISKDFSSKYPNIKYLKSKPRDIASALNTGIRHARGELIARIDCDDLAYPNRLTDQSHYLEDNPACIVVGGRIEYIDSKGDSLGTQQNMKLGRISLDDLCKGNPVAHPSVMFKRSAFEKAGRYRSKWNKVEDLDLWTRMIRVGEIHNVDTVVTKYRIHSNQVSISREASIKEIAFRLALMMKMASTLESSGAHKLNFFRILQIIGIIFPKVKAIYKNKNR